ncbi:putative bifunctional diguanylate cyclase/phosphodiesterase [Phytohalomonas tamaricis]|uniref:putative bifunctional diguanylate cyclase/phosphodiesterase n=1 Tax=Phytohalomonas tamaricis TaxID=2081032 RepID=UPI00131A3551|nr:EAL domain-containing protein [Phytohalomonas tamaricis]
MSETHAAERVSDSLLSCDSIEETPEARDHTQCASSEYQHLVHGGINASVDGIIITDARGVIQSVNSRFTLLTGYSAEESVGNRPGLLSSGRQSAGFYRTMWRTLLEQDYWQGEIWSRNKNGEVFPEWLTINAIRDASGQLQQFAAIFSDTTARKRQEVQIRRLVYCDDLTGLANRRLFLERLEQARAMAHRESRRMAVIVLDLDLFKRINCTLGHRVGDQVLSTIATRLQATVGEEESVARLGGDEFSVLVHQVESLDALGTLATQLIESICCPFEIHDSPLTLSASIGISVYPEHGESSEALLKHADTAVYRAKAAGRKQWRFYQPYMGQHNQQVLTLEQSLRRALDANELDVVYQPQATLKEGRLVGFEALLRWTDPVLGVVPPLQFIPLAEKLGLIDHIGRWVLDRVCSQLHAWRHLPRVPVAINVSALQLNDERFVDEVERCLARYSLPPELIELELTESCLIPNAEVVHKVLQRLRERRIRLLLDDFGTGYSSLSYLRRLPISVLKIDASFIRELPGNYEDGELVSAILSMAKALGLEVIAEGLETDAQADFLRTLGCGVAQGFWLAPPLNVPSATDWLMR